ncbi:hypothetical protein UPYG_G00040940 [Umbra pygmaea]|uniref:Perilipin n=1 Tax=Umbra pygmaea TaxID=75934 RepID=A0ABD0YBX5_UMBPY
MVHGALRERLWFYVEEEHTAEPSMLPGISNSSQNVIFRLANLPVVSSTCALLSVLYCDTKSSHPYIQSVCELVETSVKTLTFVASNHTTPIIIKLGPQISIVNDLACKSLDKLESNLPLLQQPPQQIVSDVKTIMMEAKDAVAITLHGAKDCIYYTLIGAVGMTNVASGGEVIMMSMDHVGQLARLGLESVQSLSKTLLDQALLPSYEEFVELKTIKSPEDATARPSSPVRRVSLTVQLYRQAYHQAKLLYVKVCSWKTLTFLQPTMDLVKVGCLVEWTSNIHVEEHKGEQGAFHNLTVSPSVGHQLHRSCLSIACSLHSLPRHLQQQVVCVLSSASQLLNNFSPTVPANPHNIKPQGKVRSSVDSFLDYMVCNTPLNCLVGPLNPCKDPVIPSIQTNYRIRKRPAKSL